VYLLFEVSGLSVTYRSIVHTEMKRFLFNQMERLHEIFLQQDPDRSGYISRDTTYAICRGAKLPVNKDLLNAVLDKYAALEYFK
jgi:Ca2+-binding EF-hand superfamily protein